MGFAALCFGFFLRVKLDTSHLAEVIKLLLDLVLSLDEVRKLSTFTLVVDHQLFEGQLGLVAALDVSLSHQRKLNGIKA